MKKLVLPLALAAALGCAPAFAQGWYVGVGAGQGTVDFGSLPANVFVDDKDTTYTVRLGYQFHRSLALEAGYYHLGDYGLAIRVSGIDTTVGAEASSVGLALVGTIPLNRFDLYGRVGYARSELKVNALALGSTLRERGRENEWFAGIGGRFHVSRELGVFAEWQRHDKLELDTYFIGVDMRF